MNVSAALLDSELPTYKASRYVTADATGSGDGLSRETAWTVAQAIASGAGQVVEFGPGVYTRENSEGAQRLIPAFRVPAGTSESPTVWFSRHRAGTTYEEGVTSQLRHGVSRGAGGSPVLGSFEHDHIVIDGFFMQESDGAKTYADSGVVALWGCKDVKLRSCVILGSASGWTDNHSGVRLENATHCEISDNFITGITTTGDPNNGAGVLACNNRDNIIQYNTIRDSGCGIHVKTNGGEVQSGYVIRRNRIERMVDCGIRIGGTNVTNPGNRTRVYQNVVLECEAAYASVGPRDVTLANNLFGRSRGSIGHFYVEPGSGNEAHNNLVWNGGGHYSWYLEVTPALVAANWSRWNHTWYHQISTFGVEALAAMSFARWQSEHGKDADGAHGTDPLFVDPSDGDFRLQDSARGIGAATSPALGAGRDVLDLLGGGASQPINIGPYVSAGQTEKIGRRVDR